MLEHIGEGSFGKVYKARRKNTGFTVAMKFITKHGKSDKDIRTLRQEIGILRKLNHENIILMFDAFETDREFCVVTEYAQGELFDILQVAPSLSTLVVISLFHIMSCPHSTVHYLSCQRPSRIPLLLLTSMTFTSSCSSTSSSSTSSSSSFPRLVGRPACA